MNDTSQIRQAVLLVAGVGSRLRPLTDKCPKCLLEVGEAPLLIRLLRQLHDHGIEHAVLATGYLESEIREAVRRGDGLPAVTIRHNPDFAETNNAESLRLAMPAVEGRPFLLCDGDILVRPGNWFGDLLADTEKNVLAMIAPKEMGDEEMKLAVDGGDGPLEERPVVALSKELDPEESAGESLGVQTISAHTFGPLSERLEVMSAQERASAYYEDIFAELMGDENPFYAKRVPVDYWTEIDTVEDLQHARSLYQSWREAEKYTANRS